MPLSGPMTHPLRNRAWGHFVLDDVGMQLRIIVPLVVLCASGCASHDSGSATPSTDAASAACQRAVPTGHVVGANATTVDQVRQHRGGPGNTSPASKHWQGLPAGQFAAWCTVQVSGQFTVGAATDGSPFVPFMQSKSNLGVYPDGPSIP
jgi:hypothetical protein